MKKDRAFYQDFDNAERVGYLIASFIKGTLTPLERKELDAWILTSDKNEQLFDELTKEENIAKTMEWYAGINEEKAYQRIKKRIGFPPRRKKVISFSFISVAASVLLIVGIASFFIWQKNQQAGTHQLPVTLSQDIPPGSDKAILTLADGRKIVLDSTAPKTVSDGMIKIDAGVISYDTLGATPPKENLLTVPRGGQFMVVLPDGTKVWLNAESSLRYMTSFIGNERRVVLNGEGYFEVTKNKEKPFIVESSGSIIRVLGTKFNVNSYKDEDAFTTALVEGSIQITKGTESKILKPGQQASVTGNSIDVVTVDTREAVAWKEGNFVFRNTPVHAIVKQLERWYDLDVEFSDPVQKHLNATISRDVPLSKVLHYLEETGEVHFKLEGRKLIVMK
jgi:transmembrane sensor